eukprot:586276-Rhodomonas_salina.1
MAGRGTDRSIQWRGGVLKAGYNGGAGQAGGAGGARAGAERAGPPRDCQRQRCAPLLKSKRRFRNPAVDLGGSRRVRGRFWVRGEKTDAVVSGLEKRGGEAVVRKAGGGHRLWRQCHHLHPQPPGHR